VLNIRVPPIHSATARAAGPADRTAGRAALPMVSVAAQP